MAAAANRMQHTFEAHSRCRALCVSFHASLTFGAAVAAAADAAADAAAAAILQCEMWQVFSAFKSTFGGGHTHIFGCLCLTCPGVALCAQRDGN